MANKRYELYCCIVLYHIVLYCIGLHCIILNCIVLYCIALYCIVTNFIMLQRRSVFMIRGIKFIRLI